MIPKKRPATSKLAPAPADPAVPDNLPLVEHRRTDIDFGYGPGDVLQITLTPEDTFSESADAY